MASQPHLRLCVFFSVPHGSESQQNTLAMGYEAAWGKKIWIAAPNKHISSKALHFFPPLTTGDNRVMDRSQSITSQVKEPSALKCPKQSTRANVAEHNTASDD